MLTLLSCVVFLLFNRFEQCLIFSFCFAKKFFFVILLTLLDKNFPWCNFHILSLLNLIWRTIYLLHILSNPDPSLAILDHHDPIILFLSIVFDNIQTSIISSNGTFKFIEHLCTFTNEQINMFILRFFTSHINHTFNVIVKGFLTCLIIYMFM